MKLMVWIGIAIGGAGGDFIGTALGHGNWFGGWAIVLSGMGSFLGLWLGYQIGKTYF